MNGAPLVSIRELEHTACLVQLINRFGWCYGAEVGVFDGNNLVKLLERCPSLRMLAVDRWVRTGGPVRGPSEVSWNTDMEPIEATARERLAQFGDRCSVLKGESVSVAKWVGDRTLDFVFIDAAHDEPAVTSDILAWTPKVRYGGGLTGHDENMPTVRAALKNTLHAWHTMPAGNVWWTLKDTPDL